MPCGSFGKRGGGALGAAQTRTSLKEIVTFSLILDLSTVSPEGLGGNWAAVRPARAASTEMLFNMAIDTDETCPVAAREAASQNGASGVDMHL